jgi:hypothetical protein
MTIADQYNQMRGYSRDTTGGTRPYDQPRQWVQRNVPLIRQRTAAEIYKVTPDQLTRWANEGKLNRIIIEKEQARMVLYYISELDEMLKKR